MIVCFRCSPETRIAVVRLVATGNYRNFGEVIEAAVRNLAVLEQQTPIDGELLIDVSPAERNGSVNAAPLAPEQPTEATPIARPKQQAGKAAHVASFDRELPQLFSLAGLPKQKPLKGLAELPADVWTIGSVVPLDRWVLGQFNKLLPAKVNCRALIHSLIESHGKPLDIDATASMIAEEAIALGDYLAAFDQYYDISRDDAFSTAFPISGDNTAKARTRYANQFVAYVNGKGEVSGLMLDLKLINVVRGRSRTKILPTKAAWEFAILRNAVLDDSQIDSTSKFAPDERRYLCDHILNSVPVEAFAYHLILDAVQRGQDTPEMLDAVLRGFVPPDRAAKLSKSFLASQRSGAVSRMSDLGLISRRREGVRVFYSVTDDGDEFLNRYERCLKEATHEVH